LKNAVDVVDRRADGMIADGIGNASFLSFRPPPAHPQRPASEESILQV
jgi:hypothetical protein